MDTLSCYNILKNSVLVVVANHLAVEGKDNLKAVC